MDENLGRRIPKNQRKCLLDLAWPGRCDSPHGNVRIMDAQLFHFLLFCLPPFSISVVAQIDDHANAQILQFTQSIIGRRPTPEKVLIHRGKIVNMHRRRFSSDAEPR